MKSPLFNNFSKLIWYLLRSDLKSYSISSSASLLIMISLLLLFECIIRSSSLLTLEEVTLIDMVNWIFHALDFLRLFVISFR